MYKAVSGKLVATPVYDEYTVIVDAAGSGVYLHGRAGDAAAAAKGAYSMIATDILDGIAEVTKA